MNDGAWLYWGNAIILEQTVKMGRTLGRYKVVKIYQPAFQKEMTIEESPPEKSYFKDEPKSFLP